MNLVFHEGQFRSFKLCVLRGDGWGCVVLADNLCRQIRYCSDIAGWRTTGTLEELIYFLPESTSDHEM